MKGEKGSDAVGRGQCGNQRAARRDAVRVVSAGLLQGLGSERLLAEYRKPDLLEQRGWRERERERGRPTVVSAVRVGLRAVPRPSDWGDDQLAVRGAADGPERRGVRADGFAELDVHVLRLEPVKVPDRLRSRVPVRRARPDRAQLRRGRARWQPHGRRRGAPRVEESLPGVHWLRHGRWRRRAGGLLPGLRAALRVRRAARGYAGDDDRERRHHEQRELHEFHGGRRLTEGGGRLHFPGSAGGQV